MSDAPRTDSSGSIPTESPRDLHPTSDIRFVIYEIGGLTAKVDRLIADVDQHGMKIDGLGNQFSFFKAAFWIAAAVLAIIASIVGWLFTNHATITFH